MSKLPLAKICLGLLVLMTFKGTVGQLVQAASVLDHVTANQLATLTADPR